MEWFDPWLVMAGILVGFVVGMTGMGGGALMTPVLILVFKVDPLTAVSSDLVVNLFMKPGGALVHIQRKTVNFRLVGWLCAGSIPAAFVGIWIPHLIPGVEDVNGVVGVLTGLALLLGATGLLVRAVFTARRERRENVIWEDAKDITVRPVPTVILGAIGGLIVGMTSVGAGSIIIVALLMLHPSLRAASLVGTDLVQAIPLVASAALSHMLFGSVEISIAASILIGAIPAAWAGAQLSSRAPDGVIRPAIFVLLLCSGAKLVGMSTEGVLVMGFSVIAAVVTFAIARATRRRIGDRATRRDDEPQD